MAVSRHLTTGETELARQVFGNSIDYAAVRVHDRPYLPFQPKSSGMTPNGEIYLRDCYSPDYSREDIRTRAFFIHEMTHVWQHQNRVLRPVVEAVKLQVKHKFNYSAAYSFQLDKDKDLTDYGMEQQASIIENYFLAKYLKCNVSAYEGTLKNFLKNPAYAQRKKFFGPLRGRKPKS